MDLTAPTHFYSLCSPSNGVLLRCSECDSSLPRRTGVAADHGSLPSGVRGQEPSVRPSRVAVGAGPGGGLSGVQKYVFSKFWFRKGNEAFSPFFLPAISNTSREARPTLPSRSTMMTK